MPASSTTSALQFEGHAIVSADGMIADAAEAMPAALLDPADFAQFQAALDRAALVVLGRKAHQRHPNRGRRRLVFTSGVQRFATDPVDALATLFNPAGSSLEDVLAHLAIEEGSIAITGGTRVFDYFASRYTSFQLSEANTAVLTRGVPCFSAGHPRSVLARHGLVPIEGTVLDARRNITSTRWQRPT